MPRDSSTRRNQAPRRGRKAAPAPHKSIGKSRKTLSEKALDRLDKNPDDLKAWEQLAGKSKAPSRRGAKKPGR